MCLGCLEPRSTVSRRKFVSGGITAAVGSAVALTGLSLLAAGTRADASQLLGGKPSHYTLWLQRMQTGETVSAPFSLDGKSLYWPGYAKLCAVLRDEHVSPHLGYVQMSVRTIEALWAVQRYLLRAGVNEPIMVHSGYRTAQTNAQTEGAARMSLHMWGKAVDFHVDAVSIADLAGVCLACPIRGGVGYYPGGWVHLDSGPRRYWEG